MESSVSKEKVTIDCLVNMANSISKCLKFTGEIQEYSRKNVVIMLDFQTWSSKVEDPTRPTGFRCKVSHKLYQKPCASKLVIMYRSAMPIRMKITTLSQETIRRMRNTGRNVGKNERFEILKRLKIKMGKSDS